VVQPDLVVICDPSKLDDKGCRGAPDWIIEVLSPGTARKDQREKRNLYERHGVREYWLLHPTDDVLMIYRLVNGVYGKPDVLALEGETAVDAIDGLVIRWHDIADSQCALVTLAEVPFVRLHAGVVPERPERLLNGGASPDGETKRRRPACARAAGAGDLDLVRDRENLLTAIDRGRLNRNQVLFRR
jgi:hypothetical protein